MLMKLWQFYPQMSYIEPNKVSVINSDRTMSLKTLFFLLTLIICQRKIKKWYTDQGKCVN